MFLGVVIFEYSGVLGYKDSPHFFETDVSEVTHFASHDVITDSILSCFLLNACYCSFLDCHIDKTREWVI